MKRRIIVAVFIILVSIIYGLPHFLLSSRLGASYTPLVIDGRSPIARDEAFAYAPEVSYITRGNILLREIYVAEYKNWPTPFLGETFPAQVFAALAKLTGSIEGAFIATDFIFPPIIFLILFTLTRSLSHNFSFAIAVAFLTTVARDFIAVIPYANETLQYLTFAEGQNYLLYLSRGFHPQFTFIIFLIAIMAMIKVLKNPASILITIALGFFFGLLFYSYVFYWTYFLLTFLLIAADNFFKENTLIVKAQLTSGILALAIGSFYFYNSWQFSKLDIYTDFITKTSLVGLPLPLTLVRYLVIAVIFALVTRLKNRQNQVLFFILLSGVFISPLSKLIIGQDLETFHYLRRALMPLATVAFFVTIYYLTRSRKILVFVISLITLSAALLLGLRTQIVAAEKIQAVHQKNRPQEAVFNWLTTNTPEDSIVGSLDTTFSSLLPVYTKNYVYFPPTDRTITPTAEGVERYAILSNILGVDITLQKNNLDNILSYLFVYQAYNDQNNLDLNSPKRHQAEAQIVKLATSNIEKEIGKFKLDYVVVTPEHLPQVHPNLKFIKPITSIDEFIIFQIDYE